MLVLKYAKNDKFSFEGNKSKVVRRAVLTYKSGPHSKKSLRNACLPYSNVFSVSAYVPHANPTIRLERW
jgi:hypothetical protein